MSSVAVRYCEECGAGNTNIAVSCFVCRKQFSSLPESEFAVSSPSIIQGGQQQQQMVLQQAMGQAKDDLQDGSLLKQRYHILEEVGRGGYGIVYKAWDRKRGNKLVAVKQINLGLLSAREIIEVTDSYNREIQLLSRLKHKNLPQIYDHFTDAQHWYVIMDFIHGQTLEEYMQQTSKNRLSVREVLNIGVELCDVLGYLHGGKEPIIFRDLKPSNIMRTKRGKLYLIDFGIARRFKAQQQRDTGSLGTPGYAAPEQYGKTAATTTRTDIYGLGATLQTLISGQEPLDRLGTAHNTDVYIPFKLQRLLEKMQERDPNRRPKDVYEVREHLRDQQIFWKIGQHWVSLLKGVLFGASHLCLLLFLVLMAKFVVPYLERTDIALYWQSLISMFFIGVYTIWPIVCLIQLISSLWLLTKPGNTLKTRLEGLGLFLGLALFLLGIMLLLANGH